MHFFNLIQSPSSQFHSHFLIFFTNYFWCSILESVFCLGLHVYVLFSNTDTNILQIEVKRTRVHKFENVSNTAKCLSCAARKSYINWCMDNGVRNESYKLLTMLQCQHAQARQAIEPAPRASSFVWTIYWRSSILCSVRRSSSPFRSPYSLRSVCRFFSVWVLFVCFLSMHALFSLAIANKCFFSFHFVQFI